MGSAEYHHASIMGKELEHDMKETYMGTVFIEPEKQKAVDTLF